MIAPRIAPATALLLFAWLSSACGSSRPAGGQPEGRPRGHAACTPSAPTGAALEIVVLGSGGPVPRGRAGASHAVLVDGVPRMLVDAGPGAAVRLGEAEVDADAIDTVLLTHLHIDHSGDLPAVVKARDLAHDGALSFFIAGPGGSGSYPSTSALVERLFGERGAFAYLRGFKNELDLRARDVPIARDGSRHVVLDAPDLRVTAAATDHGEAPAIAYRVEHGGHAVVFGGDTALSGDAVAKLAAGADVFVANTTVPDQPIASPALYALHAPPRRIAEVARDAKVGRLVLAHLSPAVIHREREVRDSMRAVFSGEIRLAHDCMRFGVTR